ncbi:hypothetical protein C8Q80DRAFT_1221691 [Daedaleopsis nitida]|nr:hypothetical protein C8Q80DRAFT_1221691 [Daedaleopsis nitida]
MVLVTSDGTPFYVHTHRLLHASVNAWGETLAAVPPPASIRVPEDTGTTRIVLYAVYGLSALHLAPTLETVELALAALIKYGVAVYKLAEPRMPLYQLVLAHAERRPLETYALAGQHHMEAVAVAASAHLLAFDTATLSDALVGKMGAGYFRRLLGCHEMRRAALKAIVLRPPRTHPPTAVCGDALQRVLQKTWAAAIAELAWDTVPGLSICALQSALEMDAAARLSCEICRSALRQRLQEVAVAWYAILQ